jgi:GDP-L-fucose synthase
MEKILLTGGTGFIGRNILPLLKKYYNVVAPARSELDLMNKSNIDNYLSANSFDILIHAALPKWNADLWKYGSDFIRC